jgi:hypothetical protein
MRRRNLVSRSEGKARARNRLLGATARILARMRRTKASLVEAARLEDIDPRAVLKAAPHEFRKSKGRWVPAHSADRLPRKMHLLDDKGRRPGLVRGSKAASLLGRYNDALAKFFSENPNYAGDESLLEPFHGKRVGGVELLTDPKKLWELHEAGELGIGDDLYAAPSGGGE